MPAASPAYRPRQGSQRAGATECWAGARPAGAMVRSIEPWQQTKGRLQASTECNLEGALEGAEDQSEIPNSSCLTRSRRVTGKSRRGGLGRVGPGMPLEATGNARGRRRTVATVGCLRRDF